MVMLIGTSTRKKKNGIIKVEDAHTLWSSISIPKYILNLYTDDQVMYIVVNIALFIITKQQKTTQISISSRMNSGIFTQ